MTPLEKALTQFQAITKAANSARYAEARAIAYQGEQDAQRAILQAKAENPAPLPLLEVVHL